jgi:hypothetical protein
MLNASEEEKEKWAETVVEEIKRRRTYPEAGSPSLGPSRGGDTVPGNIVPACSKCDDPKRSLPYDEWAVGSTPGSPRSCGVTDVVCLCSSASPLSLDLTGK